MTYPSNFYYEEKSSETSYSTTPQGTLDVGKLINGRPYWKKSSAVIKKPKPLIFTDHSLTTMPVEQIDAVIAQLLQLMKDGFTVYLQQKGEIIPLSPQSVFCLHNVDIQQKITIEGLLAANSNTQNKILTRAEYLYAYMIGGEFPTYLDSTHLFKGINCKYTTNGQGKIKVVDEYAIAKILNRVLFFKNASLIPSLLFSEFSTDIRLFLPLISVGEFFDKVQVQVQYKKATLSTPDLKELFKNQKVTQETYTSFLTKGGLNKKGIELLEKTAFKWSQLEDIEELDLQDTDITAEQLQKILAATKKLKALNITGCKNLSKLAQHNFNLPFLKRVNIYLTPITIKDLKKLLAHSTDLSNLVGLSGLTEQLTISKLKHLSYDGSKDKNDKQLSHFLSSTPPLKTLALITIPEPFNSQEINFSDLEGVFFGLVDSAELIQKALTCTGLKSLVLMNCSVQNIKPIFLLALYELSLIDSKISAKDLKQILLNTPNLHSLAMNNHNALMALDLSGLNLPLLYSLDLQHSAISEEKLLQLMSIAPNLKQITLSPEDIKNFSPATQTLLQKKFNAVAQQTETKWLLSQKQVELFHKTNLQKKLLTQLTQDQQLNGLMSLEKNEERTAVDPTHTAADHKETKPTPDNFSFQFKGLKTLNQGMIIDKLSRFLELTGEPQLIPKLQDGICNSLAHHFNTMPLNQWNTLVTAIKNWDGDKITLGLEDRFSIFQNLLAAVREHQLTPRKPANYLGDNISELFSQKPDAPMTSYIITNPWHAIAVNYSPKDQTFVVYDPNFVTEPKVLASKEELLALIKQSLGTLVSVKGISNTSFLIKDPQDFLASGGLLALIHSLNQKEMLAQLLKVPTYSKQALEGLLLRDVLGRPAWFLTITNKTTAEFTLNLLQQFAANNPDFIKQLQNSMEALSAYERHEGIVTLIQLLKSMDANPNPPLKEVAAAVVTELCKPIKTDYSKQLETWNRQTTTIKNVSEYCLKLVQKNIEKKRLVECRSRADARDLSLALFKHCKDTARPVFYINSPDDLVCSASWVELIEGSNQGILRKGPGGALHEFLTKNVGNNPVLLVNYDNFKADDIVRFNSLLDTKGLADGTPVPEDALIVGFINPGKSGSYKGADFYSRFDLKETNPLPSTILKSSIPNLLPTKATPAASAEVINLAHAEDWEERLLGRWLIKKDKLIFVEGELEKALRANKPIHLQNAPWTNPRFQIIWKQAMLLGEIPHAGRSIQIPKNIQWRQSEGYDWAKLRTQVAFTESHNNAKPILLNPKSLSSFFQQYQCDNGTKTLDCIPGLLELNKNSTLNVHLTRDLSDHEWGLLLTVCEQHEVKLSCTVAPGITLPKDLESKIATPPIPATIAWNYQKATDPLIIRSSDPATTIAMLTQKENNWMVIDLSECEASDLLGAMDGGIQADGLSFAFQEKMGLVQEALAKNKKVLLHGNFKPEMMDSLAPLLLNARDKGQLVLVGENSKSFNYSSVTYHQVSAAEKQQLLKTVHRATKQELTAIKVRSKEDFATLSYNALVAQLTYLRAFPATQGNPWLGSEQPRLTIEAFDAANSVAKAEAFIQNRLKQVNALFQHGPCVFLTGPTAVGKSTFVEKNLATQANVTLYSGEVRMEDWARDTSTKMKVLFIDEDNISSRQWSELEGLFNNPPGVVINKVYYPLSPQHKVIFARNPLSYGGERLESPLFMRHGNAVLFEPLPPELIYEKMLKPAFGTGLKAEALALAKPILDVYRFIGQQSSNEILISARELQMMALFVASYSKRYPTASAEDRLLAAQHHAYRIGASLNKEQNRAEFEAKFKPANPLPHELPIPQPVGFLVTESRQEISQLLDDVLALRELRKNGDNEAQKYGGLGGITLEGEPGIGKSELVIAGLRARGFVENHNLSGPLQLADEPPHFYRMPASMSYSEKIALLIKAFNEGAVVVVDEINSSPMMERLLNALLMGKNPLGKTPEEQLPKKPGFLIIGTQNPASMDGRFTSSVALARRLINAALAVYKSKEMEAILVQKGVEPVDAPDMVIAYENNRIKAEKEKLKPAPTFRDLTRLAEQIMAGHKVSIEPPSQVQEEALILDQEKVKKLLRVIKDLFEYGEQISDSGDEENRQEGIIAMNVAYALKQEALKLTNPKMTVTEQKQCKNNFKDILEQGDKDLAVYRSDWDKFAKVVRTSSFLELIFTIIHMVFFSNFFSDGATKQQKVTGIHNMFRALETKDKEMISDLKELKELEGDVPKSKAPNS